MIFFTDDINKGWDGSVNSKSQHNEVYVYKISFHYMSEFGGSKRKELVGTVTLLK